MMPENADLLAIRDTVVARSATTEESLARSWAAITTGLGEAQPAPSGNRRSRRRVPVRWLVPVGAAATVTAVALGTVTLLNGGGDGTDPLVVPDVPRITEPEQIRFPIDEYLYETEGYVDYQLALGELAARCLRRFGIERDGTELVAGPLPVRGPAHNQRLYGIFDREVAARWGYQAPPGLGEVWPEGVSRDRELTEQEEFLLAGREGHFANRPLPEDENGDPLPAGGCWGEADRTFTGGLPRPDFTVTNNDSHAVAAADPRVLAAKAAWSDCMSRAGYDYESISEPGERTSWAPGEEIATAVADVDCKVETNLVGIWVWVESEYQREFIQDHWDELQPLKLWLETLYENAAEVLAGAD